MGRLPVLRLHLDRAVVVTAALIMAGLTLVVLAMGWVPAG
ncbi:transmembrane transport protein [Bordetella pertussis]|nr:transmembrane transport protein [Bordetella pertussis]